MMLVSVLAYASRGWPVFPVRSKRPLTPHGLKDATTDAPTLFSWWRRWPNAEIAIATGACSGIVALDIDVRNSVNGIDSLDMLGIATHPNTPTAHTPTGGLHCLFSWPGHHVKTCTGKLGPGLDVRGDGGSITLPPGRGREWDSHLRLDSVPLAAMPDWMIVPEPPQRAPEPRQRPTVSLNRYTEAALDGAVKAICAAPAGQQRDTLNREAFSIGRLAGSGAIAPALAIEALEWAAQQMPSHDARRPWRPDEITRIVRASFSDGLRQPREVPNAR